VRVQDDDTVVISAAPVPGNEKAVSRVINKLFKAGAEVFHRNIADVHVSGHAAAEELKMMLSLVQPRYFMPIHGETRHLRAHAHLAEAVGVPTENIFVLENGVPLELGENSAREGKPVESGVMYVDGLSVGELHTGVLRDRRRLSRDGIITIVVAIDSHDGRVVSEPEVVVRGVGFNPDAELMEEGRKRLAKVLKRTAKEKATDHIVVTKAIRDSFSQFIWEATRTRPMVIPIVLEV
jgi:ribonuclease J